MWRCKRRTSHRVVVAVQFSNILEAKKKKELRTKFIEFWESSIWEKEKPKICFATHGDRYGRYITADIIWTDPEYSIYTLYHSMATDYSRVETVNRHTKVRSMFRNG